MVKILEIRVEFFYEREGVCFGFREKVVRGVRRGGILGGIKKISRLGVSGIVGIFGFVESFGIFCIIFLFFKDCVLFL